MIGVPLGFLVLASILPGGGPDDSRLFGRVTLDDGRVVEGYFRWDRNEANRADFLDASKELRREVLDEAERLDPDFAEEMLRQRSIVAFGVRIRWDEDDLEGPPRVPMAIRFAHLASLEPMEGATVRVGLVDGTFVELLGTTTDLGPGMGDLRVDTGEGELIEVDWLDIARVDFLPAPQGRPAARDSTLYGTVRTWSELELSGRVAWDRDEVFLSDVLDGRVDTADRAIPFRDIVAIAPEGRRSASVTLRTGGTVSMRGTNDVDRGNRGLDLSVPGLGRIVVPWDELEEVRFRPPAPDEDASTRIGPIRGTVYARDGRALSGTIRWGHDEEHGWEVLDGWHGDTEVQVEFGNIELLRPDGPDTSVVVLADGRVLVLEGTDDVGEGHRGLFVTVDGGATRLVRWRDVDRVIFER